MKPQEFMKHKPSFILSVETDDDTGEVLAAYFRIRQGKVDKTIDLAGGRASADYDSSGDLLGIELLAPCTLEVLDSLSEKEPAPVRRFVKDSAPRSLVTTA